MIRRIITISIALASILSIASAFHVAQAVEPDLKLDTTNEYELDLSVSKWLSSHAFSPTPDVTMQNRIYLSNENATLPKMFESDEFHSLPTESNRRLFSFELYQGDGLDDLRSSTTHNNITLPDEDTSAYGITVKQRF